MKKTIGWIVSLLLVLSTALLCLPFSAAEPVATAEGGTDLYVKAGGNGDGSSADSAFGTLQEAVTKAVTLDGDVTIHVVGTVDFDLGGGSSYMMPEHAGTLTITGDGSGKINSINSVGYFWVLGGPTVIEKVTISTITEPKAIPIYFMTDLYDFTIGEGVTAEGSMGIYGEGGNETRHLDGATGTFTGSYSVTVLSGHFADLSINRASNNRKGSKLTGGVTLTIGGEASIDVLSTIRGERFECDTSTIILDGGQVNRFVSNSDRPSVSALSFSGAKTFKLVVTKNFDVSKSFTGDLVGLYGVSAGAGSAAPGAISGFSATLEINEAVYEAMKTRGSELGVDLLHEDTFSEVVKTHDYVEKEKVPASCSSAGVEAHFECTTCDKWFVEEDGVKREVEDHETLTIEQLTHIPGDWGSDENQHWKVCTLCGEKIEETVAAHTTDGVWHSDETNHWNECKECKAEMNKAEHDKLTYTANGDGKTHKVTCGTCSEVLNAAEAHAWEWKDNPDNPDKEEIATCTKCEATGETRVKHTHVPKKVEKKDPTCTEDGNIEHWICTGENGVCDGKYYKDATCTTEYTAEEIVLKATGHNKGAGLTKHDAKAATCQAEGNIEYYSCEVCGKYFKAADGKEEITDKGSVTLAKTAHSYKDGVCTVCGEAAPNYTAPDTADRLLLPVSVLLVTSAAGYGILRRKRK